MVKETKFYDLLGVEPTATEDEIKRAYRRMAVQYHPDRNQGKPQAEQEALAEKFKAVSVAYETLSDEEKRRRYDQHGERGVDQEEGMDPSDIFSSLFGGGRRSRGEPKPKDIVHELPVALEHFYNGKVVKLAITRDRLCQPCNGRGSNREGVDARCSDCGGRGVKMVVRQLGPGFIQQMQAACPTCQGRGSNLAPQDRCPACNGEQITKEKKIFEVHVDKGMRKGDHVTFVGEGDQVPGVRLSGDIIILLDQKVHADFTRKGNHLLIERPVSLCEALTGFQRVITKLDGTALVIQPAAGAVLDPDALYYVDREGMPIKGTGGVERGNLLVKFKVQYPEQLSAEDCVNLRRVLGAPEAVQVPQEHDLGTLVKTEVDMTREASRAGGGAVGDDDDDEDPRMRGRQQQQCVHQ